MRLRIVFFTGLLACLSLTCWAQDPNEPTDVDEQSRYLGLRHSLDTCIDQSQSVMPTLIACVDTEFAYQDKRLNRIYARLMKSLSPDARTALRDEERAWIKFKQTTCAVPDVPGQGQILDAASCSMMETARRARALEHR
ncbi:DUF1311 domain-containing protein [Bacillus sp. NP157]|nr:DUF1311 domain-containing protein [Bacillus sp. NP157]